LEDNPIWLRRRKEEEGNKVPSRLRKKKPGSRWHWGGGEHLGGANSENEENSLGDSITRKTKVGGEITEVEARKGTGGLSVTIEGGDRISLS